MSESPISKEFLEFVQWLKNEDIKFKPFTNTQHNFLEFLIENEKKIPQIGNLETPFKLFRKYKKRDINVKK